MEQDIEQDNLTKEQVDIVYQTIEDMKDKNYDELVSLETLIKNIELTSIQNDILSFKREGGFSLNRITERISMRSSFNSRTRDDGIGDAVALLKSRVDVVVLKNVRTALEKNNVKRQ